MRYRRHAHQSTADSDRVARQEARLYAKWENLPGLTPEQAQMVQAAQAFRRGRFAAYTGWHAGMGKLRQGQVAPAARFLGGAARRWVASLGKGGAGTPTRQVTL